MSVTIDGIEYSDLGHATDCPNSGKVSDVRIGATRYYPACNCAATLADALTRAPIGVATVAAAVAWAEAALEGRVIPGDPVWLKELRAVAAKHPDGPFLLQNVPKLLAGAYASWCEPDDCPSSVCGGPHAEHVCTNGDRVVALPGASCPSCGVTL